MKQILAASAVLVGACARPSPTPTEPEPARSAEAREVASPDPADGEDGPAWTSAVAAEDERLRAQFPGATVRIVVLDAASGRILAQEGPVDRVHDTGSTLKSLTVAAALEAGATPHTELDCSAPVKVGGHEVSDHTVHGKLSVKQALARSSNVGVARLAETVGWRPLYERVAELLPMPEIAGLDEGAAVDLLYGGTSRATTLDLAHAYATLANGGRDPADGTPRVAEAAAAEVVAMLEYAVTAEEGTGKEAAVPGVKVAGKTGTARTGDRQTALFVGIVGADGERRIVAVVVEGVGPEDYGSTVAAPAFGRVVADARAR